jgi:formylglycine-generating enzyme
VKRLVAFVTTGTLAVFAACSSFEDGEATAPGDSGAPDAANDATTTPDGGAPLDAATDAESGGPAGMVLVTTAGTSFWIDALEVTVGEFGNFKEKVIGLQAGDAGFPPVCSFKTDLGPSSSCGTKPPNTAVSCVDWCDAFAYCKFIGKRLCGRIGGGAPLTPSESKDRFKSEWMRACVGPTGANLWPYGDGDASACNTLDWPGPDEIYDAGSMPDCVGGEPGLFDMSGNVAEISDSCVGNSGAGDTCEAHGGAYLRFVNDSKCADKENVSRATVQAHVGFRCCKDP